MNEIQIINQNGQAVVSSLEVAERFRKQHKDVLDSIRNLAAENSAAKFFFETTYENRGKQYPMYLMTRDGFSLLAMGFTGKEALAWKLKYIEAFNRMEASLKNGKALPDTAASRMRAEAMLKNAQTRQFNAIMKTIKNTQLSAVAAEMFGIAALEQVTGKAMTYRPEIESRLYSATEIGKELGVSGNLVGKIAKANGLKTEENGKFILDLCKNGKQVSNFKYNEQGRAKLKALFQEH